MRPAGQHGSAQEELFHSSAGPSDAQAAQALAGLHGDFAGQRLEAAEAAAAHASAEGEQRYAGQAKRAPPRSPPKPGRPPLPSDFLRPQVRHSSNICPAVLSCTACSRALWDVRPHMSLMLRPREASICKASELALQDRQCMLIVSLSYMVFHPHMLPHVYEKMQSATVGFRYGDLSSKSPAAPLQVESMHGLPSLPTAPPASVPYPSLEALASIAEGIGTSGGGEVRVSRSPPPGSLCSEARGICNMQESAKAAQHRLHACTC